MNTRTKEFNIDEMTKHYIIAALWASTNDEGNPLDDKYSIDDLAPETLLEMKEECFEFVQYNLELILESKQGEAQTGHDFWLTRNHHGVGFWDRELGEVGDKLTVAANSMKERTLFICDDGKIRQM